MQILKQKIILFPFSAIATVNVSFKKINKSTNFRLTQRFLRFKMKKKKKSNCLLENIQKSSQRIFNFFD